MKRYRYLIWFAAILFTSLFVFGCLGGGAGLMPEPTKPHKFKTDAADFKSTAEMTIEKKKPLKIKVCFTFDEKRKSDLPVYIIPPDESVVSLILQTTDNELLSQCRLRAYKLNPVDDPSPWARGDLFQLQSGKKYCFKYELSNHFSESELSKGKKIKAVYNWNMIDPRLKLAADGSYVCPDGQECYTIWQGKKEDEEEIP